MTIKKDIPKIKERSKLFLNGKKPINIDSEYYDLIVEESKLSGTYPSMVLRDILKNHYKEKKHVI